MPDEAECKTEPTTLAGLTAVFVAAEAVNGGIAPDAAKPSASRDDKDRMNGDCFPGHPAE